VEPSITYYSPFDSYPQQALYFKLSEAPIIAPTFQLSSNCTFKEICEKDKKGSITNRIRHMEETNFC